MPASIANADDITSSGFVAKIREAIHEIDRTVFVSRQHANSFDPDRQQDKIENDKAGRDQDSNADKSIFGTASKENDTHPIRSRIGFGDFILHAHCAGSFSAIGKTRN
jgi:hypothetical protein